MCRFAAVLIMFVILVGSLAVAPAFADDFFSIELTDGNKEALTDPSVRRYWCPTRDDSSVVLRVNDSKKTDGLYVSWFSDKSVFTITSYDENGEKLNTYKNGDKYDGFSCFYELDTRTRKVVIEMPKKEKKEYGIVYLELSDADNPDPKMMKWKSPEEKCDMLVVPTHQDDEFIFLGAVIPAYIAQGYNVAVTYSCICVRLRYEEGMKGIWNSGVRTYPDYLGFVDHGRKTTYKEAADVWGGEDSVVLALVREIRRKQPTVVVSHDENGENYHNSHVVTSKSLKKAVELASSEKYDKESLDKYGPWTVSKLYLHLYKKNSICLDYNSPLSYYGGKTAYQVASESYAFHASQQSFYSLAWSAILPGGKYDNSRFGLAYSTVGTDTVDMFYGTPKWNGKSITVAQDPPTSRVTTSQAPKTDPPKVTTAPRTSVLPPRTSSPLTSAPRTSRTPVTTPPQTTTAGRTTVPTTSTGTAVPGTTKANTGAFSPLPVTTAGDHGITSDKTVTVVAACLLGAVAVAALAAILIYLNRRGKK